MNIVIRADASTELAYGHVMRCLTLADKLKTKHANITFICRPAQGHLCDYIEEKGYVVLRLSSTDNNWQTDAKQTIEFLVASDNVIDWLVVDHYHLDARWEMAMRPHVKKIMVIDDMANRKHDCDLLLDQNFYVDVESRYLNLVPQHSKQLLGRKYSLLRPEFSLARQNLRKRDGYIKRIFIFLSGSDPTNETAKVLEGIRLLNYPDIAVDVVVGISNPYREQIKELCASLPNTFYYCQVSNMAELMARADLAIGAGGSTTWERCCLGLPSIVVILDKNQEELTNDTAKTQAIINLGWYDKVTPVDYKNAVESLNKSKLVNMSCIATQLVDGKGVVRVTEALL